MATSELVSLERIVPIGNQTDVVLARQAGREMARDLGFGTADQTRLATAMSELTRNALNYGGGGVCTVRDLSDEDWIRVGAIVEDHGPGIANIEEALTEGFSTGGSLGVGLPGARRLVQQFDIESEPGRTVVSIGIVRRRNVSRT